MANKDMDRRDQGERGSVSDDEMVRGRSDDVDDVSNDSDEFEDAEDLDEEEEEDEGTF
jgi:hypothetical protein